MRRTAGIALIGSLAASATGCLPTVYFDGGDARTDASLDVSNDGSMDTVTADTADDGVSTDIVPIEDVKVLDTVEVDVEVPCDGSACDATVTLMSPSSGSVTAGAPSIRFAATGSTTRATLVFCHDRAMSVGCSTFADVGSPFQPVIPSGTWFWQARANTGGVLGRTPSATWEFVIPEGMTGTTGATIASIPDVNGDGLGDAIIGSYTAGTLDVVYGASALPMVTTPVSAPTVIETNSRSWLAHCDVNGDGFVDVIVGIPSTSANAGSVTYLPGGPTGLGTAVSVPASPSAGDRFGSAVACAGDVNLDGLGDIVVGSPDASGGDGQVDLLLGPLSGGSMRIMPPGGAGARGRFGASIAGNGDIDNDGVPDLVVGEPSYSSLAGRVHILRAAGGTFMPFSTYPSTAGPASGFMGSQVAFVGDLNRDGIVDYAVASAPTSGMAAVHVFRSTGMPIVLMGQQGFGSSFAGVDFGGDGYWDLVVGSPGEDPPFGGIRVFPGPALTPPASVISMAGTGAAGTSVAFVGDMNANGGAELVVGAPGSNGGRGAVLVFSAPTSSPPPVSIAPGVGGSQLGVVLAR